MTLSHLAGWNSMEYGWRENCDLGGGGGNCDLLLSGERGHEGEVGGSWEQRLHSHENSLQWHGLVIAATQEQANTHLQQYKNATRCCPHATVHEASQCCSTALEKQRCFFIFQIIFTY